jgi:hypothetical protein
LRFVVLDGLAAPGILEGPDDALLERAFLESVAATASGERSESRSGDRGEPV